MWQHSIPSLFFFSKEFHGNFQWIEFKSLNPVQSFQGDSLLLTTLESVNPGLVIDKHLIDSLLFIITKQYIKYLKYKLNMINKTYLHPIRTSDYSNRLSSCHVLTSHLPSNKTSPYSKLKKTQLQYCSIIAPKFWNFLSSTP